MCQPNLSAADLCLVSSPLVPVFILSYAIRVPSFSSAERSCKALVYLFVVL